MKCPNCKRLMESRPCGDEAHRAHHGFTNETRPFQRRCSSCANWKPNEKFWDRKTRVLRQSCNQCRFKARRRRRVPLRAQRIEERANADQFWNEQSSAHTIVST